MKLKNCSILFVLCILLSCLCGCNSTAGASEDIILESTAYKQFIEEYGSCTYEIEHNVNQESKIDTVTLSMHCDDGYIIAESTATLYYQYYKDHDVWHFMDDEETQITTHPNAEKLIAESPWKGSTYSGSYYGHLTYTVDIIELEEDTREGEIVLCYSIDYEGNHLDDIVDCYVATTYHRFRKGWYSVRLEEITLYISPFGIVDYA